MAGSSLDKAVRQFRGHGGVLRTGQALALGIHPRTLYELRDRALVEQVSRGVYRLSSLPSLSQPDLVTVALRVPRAIVCLISALSFHELTTEVPHEVQIALARGAKTPILGHPPIRVFRFSEPMLSAGVETRTVDRTPIRIYSPAKTIADCFRFRNKIGLEVATEALDLGLKGRGVTPAQILHFARICRVERVVMPFLQARL
jgi:predicted transcriptional regulator of viral defense system